jgi:hypothetical protein
MKINNRKAIFTELKEYCHLAEEHDFIEVTEWTNGEGFDVSMSNKLGNTIFQITYGEFKVLKKLVKTLSQRLGS